ncbi:hypothetical protein LCGC14_2468870 [marine sediment metagenome]|uniref:Uncharacterized protein n=1 Tax=marine sediment metagenome TaxID=412755 RepID=A0A0F9BYS0_9ZZZZ
MVYLYLSIAHLVVGVLITVVVDRLDLVDLGKAGGRPDTVDYTVAVMAWPLIVAWIILKSFGYLAMRLAGGEQWKS